MSADASREAFEAWHSDRAKRIAKEINDLFARWITEGANDSPATKREALLYVMRCVDGTGWDAWKASRKQALTEAAEICDAVLACPSLGARHCAEYIRNLK